MEDKNSRLAVEQLDAITKLFAPDTHPKSVKVLKAKLDEENRAIKSIRNTKDSVMNTIACFEEARERALNSTVINFSELRIQLETAMNELYEMEEHLADKQVKQETKRNKVQDEFFAVCDENNNSNERLNSIFDIVKEK